MKIGNTHTFLTLAGLTMACSASLHGAALIYEPFAGAPGGLSGQAPGAGLTGNWGSNGMNVVSGSLSYGNLETSGNRAGAPASNFSRGNTDPGTTLTGAGLLADGAELWFSALAVSYDPQPGDNGTSRTYIAFGNGTADGFDRVGDHSSGRGFEIKLNDGFVQAFGWRGPGTIGGAGVPITDGTHLVVGKITWGEFGVVDDTLELFLPDTDLNMGSAVSTTSHDFDQLGTVDPDDAFDVISFAGGHRDNAVPEVDEIRFGATYADVTPAVPEPSSMALLALGGLVLLRRCR
ncbi:MAG: PEP-CTERM sorting domain-containing protein [Akkermansiaceae bacterium]